MSAGRLVLRASMLPDFLDCPRRALARVFEAAAADAGVLVQRDRPLNVATMMGTALHLYAEKGGVTAEELIAEACGGRAVLWDRQTPGVREAKAQLRLMIEAFEARHGATWLEGNKLTEQQLEWVYVVDGREVLLTGKPDKVDGEGRVHDLKTGRRRPGQHGAQLGAYISLAEQHGFGGDDGSSPSAVIHWVARPGLKMVMTDEHMDSEDYPRDDAVGQMEVALRAAVRAAVDFETYGPGRIHANPKSSLCSPDYCTAHGTDWCAMTRKI